ncbi:hypothetical protein TRAPUB_2298 [Trametes pubescens]|uniref:Uncharacterized protein n=1 Tax=Trametes pubescens TaxID=154538 RepID=A0A1M2VH05_TRAPU|nr:hypothetical protein TRAPUB_2298 [Trametes pubescens]
MLGVCGVQLGGVWGPNIVPINAGVRSAGLELGGGAVECVAETMTRRIEVCEGLESVRLRSASAGTVSGYGNSSRVHASP